MESIPETSGSGKHTTELQMEYQPHLWLTGTMQINGHRVESCPAINKGLKVITSAGIADLSVCVCVRMPTCLCWLVLDEKVEKQKPIRLPDPHLFATF